MRRIYLAGAALAVALGLAFGGGFHAVQAQVNSPAFTQRVSPGIGVSTPRIQAGSAIIGQTGIDQTTDGTTNAVSITSTTIDDYETIAASQTAQAMGATGATGDYLAGCTVVPGTTSPGVVTILDNATAIVSFPGGASSLSNLVPFYVAIGAKSVSGAWKITTGANVTVACFGKFT